MTWYLDASALVKLVVRERESVSLAAFVHDNHDGLVTSELGRLEVLRFGHRVGEALAARNVVDAIDTLTVSSGHWERAASVMPQGALRSLDALHLACLALRPSLAGVVTYDTRMIEAATTLGYAVLSPA